MTLDMAAINERVRAQSGFVDAVKHEVAKVIVGQETLIERLLIAMLCRGHVLIEGVPGLAKTLTVSTLARAMDAAFVRIQFTPDMLPADVTGTTIYSPQDGEFHVRKGPIFANIVLADEINRAPAKVQSALLEAMQERQVSIGGSTFPLDEPFMVLATQNPIEHEGTYPLPEAQLDRFMLKVRVRYPSREEEKRILDRFRRARRRRGGEPYRRSGRDRPCVQGAGGRAHGRSAARLYRAPRLRDARAGVLPHGGVEAADRVRGVTSCERVSRSGCPGTRVRTGPRLR